MNKNKKYVKPSSSDINNLIQAQYVESEINKLYKDKLQTEIMFYCSLFLFCFGFLFWSTTEAFSTISGIGLFGLILSGASMHSHKKGQQGHRSEYLWDQKQKILKKVGCKHYQKENKFYVYLEDGRKIEVDEY